MSPDSAWFIEFSLLSGAFLNTMELQEHCEWKHWWAVAESDRLRLRVEIDAIVADLYGLDPTTSLDRADDPETQRVLSCGRQLPFRER